MFNRLQGIKNSGDRVAHIHISETVSNAHICRFCFWYASQQIKPLIASDVELILWTASGLQSGKEQILRLMLHSFPRWALSCIELSAPGVLCWPSAGMVAEGRKEDPSDCAGNLRWKALGLCSSLTASPCKLSDSIYNELDEVRSLENGGLGMAEGS